MPRVRMKLAPEHADDMRGICALMTDLVVRPEDADSLTDEVLENLRSVDGATLLCLSDLTVVLQVLIVQEMQRRGGRDGQIEDAVASGQAEWVDAPAET